MSGRRNVLENLRGSDFYTHAHAGLWLDKFLYEPNTSETERKRKLLEDVTIMSQRQDAAALYKAHYERWQGHLTDSGAVCRVAKAKGRIILGLGAESVWENAIALHRVYGVPYLAGSALKGLARSCARRLEGWDETHTTTAFGTTDASGYITFYDALYVPGSGYNRGAGPQALHRDVLTVHHQKYYQGKPDAPADWDEPVPVPFLTATGKYLVALTGPEDWVKVTFQILEIALREEGIGAKTFSGYGRMSLS